MCQVVTQLEDWHEKYHKQFQDGCDLCLCDQYCDFYGEVLHAPTRERYDDDLSNPEWREFTWCLGSISGGIT